MDRGDIHLCEFLYADLTGSKRRPVCVVSALTYNAGQDVMVAMISSGTRVTAPSLGDVPVQDWQQAGLLRPSVVRAGRLQVIEQRLLSSHRGRLSPGDLAAVDQALKDVLGL